MKSIYGVVQGGVFLIYGFGKKKNNYIQRINIVFLFFNSLKVIMMNLRIYCKYKIQKILEENKEIF